MYHNRHNLSLIRPPPPPPTSYHIPLPLPPLTATLHTLNYSISPCLHQHNFSPSLLLFIILSLVCFVALSTPRPVSVAFNLASLEKFYSLDGDEQTCCLRTTYRNLAVPGSCFCSYYYISLMTFIH